MLKNFISETKLFLNSACSFIFIVSIILYLILNIFNILIENYLITYFDFYIILFIAVISGFMYILTKEEFNNGKNG